MAYQLSYNAGFFDGLSSASFHNPIHNNWKLDHRGKLTHVNREYLAGYIDGFEHAAGYRPACFPR